MFRMVSPGKSTVFSKDLVNLMESTIPAGINFYLVLSGLLYPHKAYMGSLIGPCSLEFTESLTNDITKK